MHYVLMLGPKSTYLGPAWNPVVHRLARAYVGQWGLENLHELFLLLSDQNFKCLFLKSEPCKLPTMTACPHKQGCSGNCYFPKV